MDSPLTSAPGIFKTKVASPHRASLCSVPISKIVATPSGDKPFGFGTGFHYRCANGRDWLVTNWHVLTARRPDNPGILLGVYPQSPHRIEIPFPTKTAGQFLAPLPLDLYEGGRPIWNQFSLAKGVDLAAIPLNIPDEVHWPAVQDFAERDANPLRPGDEVVIVGCPFLPSIDRPYPIWKRAMVASEPMFTIDGIPQVLLDAPGHLGMSGSPVYKVEDGITAPKPKRDQTHMQYILSLSADEMKPTKVLTFVGVYAGTPGKVQSQLESLALGRMFLASHVDAVAMCGEPGLNEFPPGDIKL